MFYYDKRAEAEKLVEDEEIAEEIASTDLPTDIKVELMEDAGVDEEIIDEVIDAEVTDAVAAYYGVNPYWIHDKKAAAEEAEAVPENVDPSTWESLKAWLTQRGIDAKEWISDPNNKRMLLGGGLGGLLGTGMGYLFGGGLGAGIGGTAGAGLGGMIGANYADNPQMANALINSGVSGLAGAGLGYALGGGLGAGLGGMAGAGLGYALGMPSAPYIEPAPVGAPVEAPVEDYPVDQVAAYHGSAWLMDKLANTGSKTLTDKQRKALMGAGAGTLGGAALGYALGGGKGAMLGGLAGAGLGGAGGYNFDRIQNLIGQQDSQPGAEIRQTTESNKTPDKAMGLKKGNKKVKK